MRLSTITTQRIDRLSNTKLGLGLKTGTYLEATSSLLTVSNDTGSIRLKLGSAYTAPTNDTDATPKKYVDTEIINAKSATLSKIVGSTRVTVNKVTGTGGLVTDVSLSLGDAYNSTWFGRHLTGKFSSNGDSDIDYAVFTGQSDTQTYGNFAANDTNSGAGAFISAIKVDKYGAIVGVDYKRVAASDLVNSGTFDNYQSWTMKVGSTPYQITSGSDESNPFALEITGAGITPTVTQIVGGAGYTLSLAPDLDSTYFELDSSNKITHKHNTSLTNALVQTPSLFKATVDTAGHIVSTVDVAPADIKSLLGAHSSSTDGYVPAITDENTNAALGADAYVYTSEGKWGQIPFAGVTIASATKSGDIPLALSDDSHNITTLKYNTNIKANPSTGILTATGFSGGGSGLTGLNASNISTGSLNSERLPIMPLSKGGLGAALETSGVLVKLADDTTVTTVTRPENASGDYVLVSEKLANNKENLTFKNFQNIISDTLSNFDSMVYRGTIGKTGATFNSTDDEVNLETLLGSYKVGSTYKVVTDMVLVESEDYKYKVEAGDTIIALHNAGEGSLPRFNVIQANLAGAVIYSNGTTATAPNEIAVFNSSDGTKIKGTGIKIETKDDKLQFTGGITIAEAIHAESADNAETADKLSTENLTIFGNAFDGSASLPTTSTITIEKVVANSESATIGDATNAFATVYATELHGTADKVAHKLYLPGYTDAEEANKDNYVFDGSKDITLTIAALGGISGVTIPAKNPTGNGYFISNLVATGVDGAMTITPTYTKAITSITENLFSVGNIGADGALTIAPYTSKTTGKFYTLSDKTNTLFFAGSFAAEKLYADYTFESTTYSLPALTATPYTGSESLTADTILVAKDLGTENGIKTYSYEKSGVHIIKSNTPNATNFASDEEIPTSKAVATYVQTQVNTLNGKAIKTLSLVINSASTPKTEAGGYVWETGSLLSSKDVIQRIAVEVKTAVTATDNPGLIISNGATTIMSSDENDLKNTGVYIDNYYYQCQDNSAIKATITSSEATGLSVETVDAVVHIDYYTNEA